MVRQQDKQPLHDDQLYPQDAADPSTDAAPLPPPQPAPQQHQVIVQPAPYYEGHCGRRLESFKVKQSVALGITQISIGVLCIIFNLIGLLISNSIDGYWQFTIGYGIWPSVFFIIAGGFGIAARSKNWCPVITFMVMSIIAAVFTTIVIGFSASGIFPPWQEDVTYYEEYQNWGSYTYVKNPTRDEFMRKHTKLAMHCLLLILGLVEAVVAIWSSIICCAAACCYSDNRGMSQSNGEASGRSYGKYKVKQSFRLGLMQICIAILCIFFNIIGIVLQVYDVEYISEDFMFMFFYGIWPSVFFLIAGGFGMGARSKNRCPVIAFMVMSIIAAVFATFVMGFAATGIALVLPDYNRKDHIPHGRMAMHVLLFILGFVEFVVAIWSSAICCAAACCCCNNNGILVQYGGQAGQQQTFINAQGQQQTFNSQPQPGDSSYPAARPGLAQPSASAPGRPPAYSAASAPPTDEEPPPAYEGPPHEEKSHL